MPTTKSMETALGGAGAAQTELAKTLRLWYPLYRKSWQEPADEKCIFAVGVHSYSANVGRMKGTEMEYMTVKETAKAWNVSVRTVNMYLNAGRVPGAIRKEHGWLVPADARKPEDRRRRQSGGPMESRTVKCFMPILALAYPPGGFEQAVGRLGDPEEREMARAGHYYFQGSMEAAQEKSASFLQSECADIRLSALWIHAMASLSLGDVDACMQDFESVQREGASAQDETVRVESEFIAMVSDIYFHREEACVSDLLPHFAHLSDGLRYFALYARAHALYLRGEYRQAVGEVGAALALMQGTYPIAAIYLNIVGAMACNSMAEHKEAQHFFDAAWELAAVDGYFEPLAEHHGMLQGLVERKTRGSQPELYQRISELVYRFSRGWMKIHNPNSQRKVTDALTPYEFSIAMLAAKGRSNKEIADYLSISVNSVKAYLATIYQKIGITKRSELRDYVNY